MTPKQINEGNLAIADFLGWVKPDKRNKSGYRLDVPYQWGDYEPLFVWETGLNFHGDWNMIMLAWEKVATYHETTAHKSLEVEGAEIYGHRCRLDYSWKWDGGIFKYDPEKDSGTFDGWVGDEESLLTCVFLVVSNFCLYWRVRAMRT